MALGMATGHQETYGQPQEMRGAVPGAEFATLKPHYFGAPAPPPPPAASRGMLLPFGAEEQVKSFQVEEERGVFLSPVSRQWMRYLFYFL